MKEHCIGYLELLVLLSIERLGDRASGVRVQEKLEAHTQETRSLGSISTTIERMETKGLLASTTSAPRPVRGGRRVRFFTLTDAGREKVARSLRPLRSLMSEMMFVTIPHHD